MFSKVVFAVLGVFTLSNARLSEIPATLFNSEAAAIAKLNAQVASYQVQIDNAQLNVQTLYTQMTTGNHKIFQTYVDTANIFSALKQQNSSASQCVNQYGTVPAVGNFTDQTTSAVETAMKDYQKTLDGLTKSMKTARTLILDMVNNVENCFSTFLRKQSPIMLNMCTQTAMASGRTQVIVTLSSMDAPIALIPASVSIAEAGVTIATSTYNAAVYVALYNVYHCISPEFYNNGKLIINGSTVVVGGTNCSNVVINIL